MFIEMVRSDGRGGDGAFPAPAFFLPPSLVSLLRLGLGDPGAVKTHGATVTRARLLSPLR